MTDNVMTDDVTPIGQAAGEPIKRVVFGDEIGVGTVVLERCHGPKFCRADASRHSPSGSYTVPDPEFHELTVLRLREAGTAVVADQDGVEQPWLIGPHTPVRVLASTLPVPAPDDATAPEDAPAPEWPGIPADPRWDSYRLRVTGPRWRRPWWTVTVEYVGAWSTDGDQILVRLRSRNRVRAIHEAIDTLVYHCQWLAEGPRADLDLVPVVWLGEHLVPVARVAELLPGGVR